MQRDLTFELADATAEVKLAREQESMIGADSEEKAPHDHYPFIGNCNRYHGQPASCELRLSKPSSYRKLLDGKLVGLNQVRLSYASEVGFNGRIRRR